MAETDNTRYDLEEVSTNLSKLKSLLFVLNDADGVCDDREALSWTLGIASELAVESCEALEAVLTKVSTENRAYPKWFEEKPDVKNEATLNDLHPMLQDFITQTSSRIGELSAAKSQQKLIEIAAETGKGHSVDEVIQRLKAKIDHATPVIFSPNTLHLIKSASESQQWGLERMAKDLDRLREDLVACGEVGFADTGTAS